jgi:hypothetical protein
MTSEVYRKPMRMTCEEDGRVRSVAVKCYRYDGSFAADTFFSVPASCRVRGRYVAGYVTSGESGLRFRAFDRTAPLFWLNAGGGR